MRVINNYKSADTIIQSTQKKIQAQTIFRKKRFAKKLKAQSCYAKII